MPAPTTSQQFLEFVRKSGIIDRDRLEATLERCHAAAVVPAEPKALATLLVREGVLTRFHAEQFLLGRWRGFSIGKYQILERLGSGGMGIVYLAEHIGLRRRVALKVLPLSLAENSLFLDHFYREAQAAACLNHPNIVRAHDVGQAGKLHFLVMEYVDGANLQDIVDNRGPLSIPRAVHYIQQAALGLQHIHDAGMVHRDIKPGNVLLNRQGAIKILDMGLVRLLNQNDKEVLAARGYMKMMVGTDDYLAPEQIVNSDDVDNRADIYSLGATFYFLLTGNPPFNDATLSYQKLIRHLAGSPKPIRLFRPDAPAELIALVEKLMAKNPWDRFRTAGALAAALAPWLRDPVPLPSLGEIPSLSPALQLSAAGSETAAGTVAARPAGNSSVVRWEIKGPASRPGVSDSSSSIVAPQGAASSVVHVVSGGTRETACAIGNQTLSDKDAPAVNPAAAADSEPEAKGKRITVHPPGEVSKPVAPIAAKARKG